MSDFPAFHITLAENFCISALFSLKTDFNLEIRFTLSTTNMVHQLSLIISVEILLNVYVYVKTKIVVIITLYILSFLSRSSICDVISTLKGFISKYHLFLLNSSKIGHKMKLLLTGKFFNFQKILPGTSYTRPKFTFRSKIEAVVIIHKNI